MFSYAWRCLAQATHQCCKCNQTTSSQLLGKLQARRVSPRVQSKHTLRTPIYYHNNSARRGFAGAYSNSKRHSCKEGSKGIPKAGILEVGKLRVLVTASARKRVLKMIHFFWKENEINNVQSFNKVNIVMASNLSY